MKHCRLLSFLLVLCAIPTLVFGQSGKIAGRIIGADSNEPLPGANVIVDGTTLGAAADLEGYYTIINVPPGTYTLTTSFIGYAKTSVQEVRVSINQTTTIDFSLKAEAIAGEEITVVSERPIVEADVSANVANVQAAQVENVPVAGVSEFINLQSGVEPGLRIRGSGFSEMAYLVDGITTRNARDNAAYTNVSYTGIEEFQVQTGGFNAEYGNVRSGLINVVTKEGSRDRYSLDLFGRYTATENTQYFGHVPWLFETTTPTNNSADFQWTATEYDNFFTRPLFDPAVAMDGAAGVWDKYTQESYVGGVSNPWVGWNALAAADPLNSDEDPNNNVTGQDLQDMMAYELRRDNRITDHGWVGDGTLAGPVPVISNSLGDLRFALSHRRTQSPYVIPYNFQSRDSYRDHVTQFKVTSDVRPGKMKLQVSGLLARETAINGRYNAGGYDFGGPPVVFRGDKPAYPWDQQSHYFAWDAQGRGNAPWFVTNLYVPLDLTTNILGLDFTHTLTANTFYKIRVSRSYTKYETPVQDENPRTIIGVVGNQPVDDAPFGQRGLTDPLRSRSGFSSFTMGGILGSHRDSSDVSAVQVNFDLTSQVNRWAQIKTGVEGIFNDFNVKTGFYDKVFPQNGNAKGGFNASPLQGAAYAQAKLEFQGMIANVGVRLDYYDPKIDWPSVSAFDPAFGNKANFKNILSDTPLASAEKQTTLSPRLGVSFPITHNSKLYFNFGHFRQFLDSDDLYAVRGLDFGRVNAYGNPNQPFPTTVAYELGYDHNLADTYLLRVAGFYKDRSNQQRTVQFFGYDQNDIQYYAAFPLDYSDIRGFEVNLNKNVGRWVRGFVNYTYLQTKSGRFGFSQYHENRREQSNFEATNTDHYLSAPVAEPFGRANIEFLIPRDKGALLGDWRADLLAEWRAGQHFTWSGLGTNNQLNNNVQYKDYFNFDLRISKNFDVSGIGRAQLFLDVQNVFNVKRLYKEYGEEGTQDWENYMMSLHLDKDTFIGPTGVDQAPYVNIPGDDRPGDYRDADVAWVPIERAADLASLPAVDFVESGRRVLGYAADSQTYYELVNGSWQAADQSFVNQVLDDKAYINMPNFSTLNFLNPRAVQLGLRLFF